MYKSKGIHIEEEKVLTEPSHNIYIKWFSDFFFVLVILKELTSLKRKKMISIPLMMENPDRSPMVPPMRLS